MQQLTDAAASRKAKTALAARREPRRRPQSARAARRPDGDADPFAYRRLLHPRDFHKGILDVAAAEQIIRRGMPAKPPRTNPSEFKPAVHSGGCFSVSAPIRAQRHLGDWDMVRCTAPARTWPSKGAVSILYDEMRQGRPPWKPSSSQSKELNPMVTLEGKAPENRTSRPQSAPPSGQRPLSARNSTSKMQTSAEQQGRPMSARSSQGCANEQTKPAMKQSSTAETRHTPSSGWAGR